MSNFLEVQDSGITWLIRVVKSGDGYGRWNKTENTYPLIHTNENNALVEFYDTRNTKPLPFFAQFVSRYYVNTLLENKAGLNLEDSIPSWSLSAQAMSAVRLWLRSHQDVTYSSDDPAIHEHVTVAGTDGNTGHSALKSFDIFMAKSESTLQGFASYVEDKAQKRNLKPPFVIFNTDEESSITTTGRAIWQRGSLSVNARDLREKDLTLAALRWFQSCMNGDHDMSEVDDICPLDTITASEIDDLCERINFRN